MSLDFSASFTANVRTKIRDGRVYYLILRSLHESWRARRRQRHDGIGNAGRRADDVRKERRERETRRGRSELRFYEAGTPPSDKNANKLRTKCAFRELLYAVPEGEGRRPCID